MNTTETGNWISSLESQVLILLETLVGLLVNLEPILVPLLVVAGLSILYLFGSVKIINEGNEGIVERLGKYRRSLKPGLNFVIPVLDTVLVETTREQILDIEPLLAITRDNVPLTVDAVMFWKILNSQKAYYAVADLQSALTTLVITALRGEIAQMDLRETVSSRNKINQALLLQLDEATERWGVKIMRVEVQELAPSRTMLEALELERAAESRRRATISEVEGAVEANIRKTGATIKSMQYLSEAMQSQPYAKEILQFLLAQDYVQANYRLAESDNAKVVFMDPKLMPQIFDSLSNSPNFDVDSDLDE